jgi:hypothetical protein
MDDPAAGEGVLESAGDVILPDDLVEGLRTIAEAEGNVCHETTGRKRVMLISGAKVVIEN